MNLKGENYFRYTSSERKEMNVGALVSIVLSLLAIHLSLYHVWSIKADELYIKLVQEKKSNPENGRGIKSKTVRKYRKLAHCSVFGGISALLSAVFGLAYYLEITSIFYFRVIVGLLAASIFSILFQGVRVK